MQAAKNGEIILHQIKTHPIPLIEHYGATKLTAKGLPSSTATTLGTFAAVALRDSSDYMKRRLTIFKNVSEFAALHDLSGMPSDLGHQVLSSVYQSTWKIPSFDWDDILRTTAALCDETEAVKIAEDREIYGTRMFIHEPQTCHFQWRLQKRLLGFKTDSLATGKENVLDEIETDWYDIATLLDSQAPSDANSLLGPGTLRIFKPMEVVTEASRLFKDSKLDLSDPQSAAKLVAALPHPLKLFFGQKIVNGLKIREGLGDSVMRMLRNAFGPNIQPLPKNNKRAFDAWASEAPRWYNRDQVHCQLAHTF